MSAVYSPGEKIEVAAIVVPRVTCDLPLHPVTPDSSWDHLTGITLADPDFGRPGKVDLLLGVEVFADVMLHGRRHGPPGSPIAFETRFGWVLAGTVGDCISAHHVAVHHVCTLTGDDILKKFWELEEKPTSSQVLSPEERSVVQHFQDHHTRSTTGRFIVSLPRKPGVKSLGESRSAAVRRFFALECSLNAKGLFKDFDAVMREYLELEHAEVVPNQDLHKPPEEVFYLPVHLVRKESSTTTKLRAVFDASAKSATSVSLNDQLLVGPTVHSSLVDVLLRFRRYRVALTTDVSKMYRCVELVPSDRDLHRFVWRSDPAQPLQDYRMTRLTFGVSASCFAANMAVKQNAIDHALDYPQAFRAVEQNFYVDDGLSGSDSVSEAVALQAQLQELFAKAEFLLRKWNSSSLEVLQQIPLELRDPLDVSTLPSGQEYSKTLGMRWHSRQDHFCLTVSDLLPLSSITKRVLVSDVAKVFDALGWYTPVTVKMKILLQ